MATREEYEDAIKKIKEAFYSAICEEWELEQIAVNLDFLLSLINEHFKEHPETNYEHYKDEILENCLDSLAVVKGRPKLCYKTSCNDCDFKLVQKGCHKKVMDWLKQTYQKPTYKLTQFEYDLLSVHKDYKTYNNIANQIHLFKMREKGYFKDVDTNISIREILGNCEVIK